MGPGSVDVPTGVALGGPPAAPRGRAAAPARTAAAPGGAPAPAATASASGATAATATAPAAAAGLLGLGDDVVETHVDLVRHLKTE